MFTSSSVFDFARSTSISTPAARNRTAARCFIIVLAIKRRRRIRLMQEEEEEVDWGREGGRALKIFANKEMKQ